MVQLRSKSASTSQLIALAQKIKKITEQSKIPLIINDRVDVALAIQASGVHLGQSDMPAEYARNILGDQALIGLSVSTSEQAKMANHLPVDYLGAGPVFETQTKKKSDSFLSLEDLTQICESSCYPVIGIGGISRLNTASVKKTGVQGIAVVSAICSSPDPQDAAMQLRGLMP